MPTRPLETLLHPHHVSLLTPTSSTLQTLYHSLDDRLTPANFALDHGRAHRGLGVPRFDVRETSSAYILYGEVPGVRDPADVAVEWLQGKVLLVHGVVPVEDEDGDIDGEEGAGAEDSGERVEVPHRIEMKRMGSNLCHAPKHLKAAVSPDGRPISELPKEPGMEYPVSVLCERQVGQFQRSFTFPLEVEPGKMKTRLEHGLLRIWLPKKRSSSA